MRAGKTEADREARARFYFWQHVAYGKACAVCGAEPFRRHDTQAHHVARRQLLAPIARELGLEPWRVEWDTANGLAVCRACHDAHTAGTRRIPRASLRPENLAFLATYDLERELEHYA